MAQDLRDMFKNRPGETLEKIPDGHEKRFAQKLDKNFHASLPARQGKKEAKKFQWYKIAAVFVILFGIGFLLFQQTDSATDLKNELVSGKQNQAEIPVDTTVYLSEVSPAYKKIEDYYLAALHTELAQLDVTDENKLLIDSFMAQLAELDAEYKRLNAELAITGVNEETVSTLIENLTLRLDLLFKLKMKLEELQKPETV